MHIVHVSGNVSKEHAACHNICTQKKTDDIDGPTDKIRCYSRLTSKAETSNFVDLFSTL